jgi:hypothetical protein
MKKRIIRVPINSSAVNSKLFDIIVPSGSKLLSIEKNTDEDEFPVFNFLIPDKEKTCITRHFIMKTTTDGGFEEHEDVLYIGSVPAKSPSWMWFIFEKIDISLSIDPNIIKQIEKPTIKED